MSELKRPECGCFRMSDDFAGRIDMMIDEAVNSVVKDLYGKLFSTEFWPKLDPNDPTCPPWKPCDRASTYVIGALISGLVVHELSLIPVELQKVVDARRVCHNALNEIVEYAQSRLDNATYVS